MEWYNFLSRHCQIIRHTIAVQDQGIAVEWIEDYNPLPSCHIRPEFRRGCRRGGCIKFHIVNCWRRPRRILAGFNLRLDVSKRQRYCEANGKPFDAEIYNTPMSNPNPRGFVPFDKDFDVYIGARCQDMMQCHGATIEQGNTHLLVEPPMNAPPSVHPYAHQAPLAVHPYANQAPPSAHPYIYQAPLAENPYPPQAPPSAHLYSHQAPPSEHPYAPSDTDPPPYSEIENFKSKS